jgi:hypothetical protein
MATARLLGRTTASSGAAEEITVGTGLSLSAGSLTNSAPDQTVVLTAGTGISISSAYPNFTITNSAPDQTVSLTGAGTTVVTGTYPNFTITSNDQYTGTVTSVGLSGGTTGLSVSGTNPITTSGTFTLGGTLGVANGGTGTGTAFTAGSIVFAGASGVYSQDNANLFWDDSNNRLGIGTTSPNYAVEVAGDLRLAGGGDLRLGSATGTTGTAGDSSIFSDANDMYLNTGNVTRMYIANGGNVGIGNTGPTYRLDVSSADTTANLGYAMRIRANATAGGGTFQFTDSGATAQWGFLAATATSVTLDATNASILGFRTNNNERMRIDSSGNVGIGTSSPTFKLQVTGTLFTSSNVQFYDQDGFRFASAAAYTSLRMGSSYTGESTGELAYDRSNGAFTYKQGNTGSTLSEYMRITSAGNVGIGTTSPNFPLDIQRNSATSEILRVRNDTVGAAAFVTARGGGGGTVDFGCGADASTFVVRTASSERMRIDSSGNVGIGTSSPNYKLEVFGSPAWMRNFAGTPSSPTETQDWPVSAFNVASYGDFTLQTMMAFTLPNDGNYFLGYGVWNFKLDQTASSTTSSGVAGMQFGGPGYLSFMPGTSEKARITSGGAFLVGTTSPLAGNTSNEFRNNTAGLWPLTLYANDRGLLVRNTASGSGFYAYFEYNNGTNNGSISWSGGTTAYNTTSDYRLKEIEGPITNSGAYIDALNPVQGHWKADGTRFVGLVAHEVQEVSETPVVTGEKDGEMMQQMDYSSPEIIGNMIAELKSLRARVAQLEGK